MQGWGGIAAVGDSIGFWQHQVVAVAAGLRKSHCWFMSYFSTASERPLNVGPEANFHFGVKWQSTRSRSQGLLLSPLHGDGPKTEPRAWIWKAKTWFWGVTEAICSGVLLI